MKTLHEIRRILVHDWPLLTLIMANLVGISLYLGAGPSSQHGAGYRVIDIQEIRQLIDAGTLNSHEAKWFHPSTPEEK